MISCWWGFPRQTDSCNSGWHVIDKKDLQYIKYEYTKRSSQPVTRAYICRPPTPLTSTFPPTHAHWTKEARGWGLFKALTLFLGMSIHVFFCCGHMEGGKREEEQHHFLLSSVCSLRKERRLTKEGTQSAPPTPHTLYKGLQWWHWVSCMYWDFFYITRDVYTQKTVDQTSCHVQHRSSVLTSLIRTDIHNNSYLSVDDRLIEIVDRCLLVNKIYT